MKGRGEEKGEGRRRRGERGKEEEGKGSGRSKLKRKIIQKLKVKYTKPRPCGSMPYLNAQQRCEVGRAKLGCLSNVQEIQV